jgi:tetratricopeptide (TPR) repeat protein
MPRRILVGLVLLSITATSAVADDTLQRLKDLYAAAAYEDVLAVVTRPEGTEVRPELEQYRVFCLVALGRTSEAERIVEDLIRENPRYRPDASEASPRIQELFSKVRRRVGPSLVKTMYVDAKAALDRKDRDAAIAEFERMLKLADDPDVKDDSTVAELRLLGSGFLDLSRAIPAKLPAVAASVAAAPVTPPVVTPPLAIRENLPPWIPMDATSRFVEFRGAVRVRIDAEGKVASAEMAAPVHPSYDRLLLVAAKDWLYQPAKTNGTPVPSEKVVQVVLKPR